MVSLSPAARASARLALTSCKPSGPSSSPRLDGGGERVGGPRSGHAANARHPPGRLAYSRGDYVQSGQPCGHGRRVMVVEPGVGGSCLEVVREVLVVVMAGG